MALNQSKVYNNFLEISFMSEVERNKSLKKIFDRDIANNPSFHFQGKVIRPLKVDGNINLEILFKHLTCESKEILDEAGRKVKSRGDFEIERSKRLHWLWFHIQQSNKDIIDVFSFEDRINGKNVVRTYIYDLEEKYVVILEPQRSKRDYYLLTAYHLTNEKKGINQIEKKRKRRLPEIH